jgi:hypothetical protein
MVRKALKVQVNVADLEKQKENIFHTRCHVQNKLYSMIINSGSCTNITSTTIVDKLNLHTTKHFMPYKLWWLNDCGVVKVIKQVLVLLYIGKYYDEVLCDVIPMHASHLLLGR